MKPFVTNPAALSWKHDHEPGIRCAENDKGQIELVGWPDSLGEMPTQSQIEKWETEFAALPPAADPQDELDAALADATTFEELLAALTGRVAARPS